jgi:large subunit ribosomal protein L23
MKSPYEVLIKPLITEKSSGMATRKEPQYVFAVHPTANKVEIRHAVESAFQVQVLKVNTMRMLGKNRRIRIQQGRRPSWKKAIVTIKEGQQISLY